LLLVPGLVPTVSSEQASIAVAANFLKPLESLKPLYEHSSRHTIIISGGSTGQLYAQIRNGAPYDVFLSADAERPRLLEEEGRGVAGTRFTYALGKLTLWSSGPVGINGNGPAVLEAGNFRSLAIANPELAPYGLAARQTLERLQVRDRLQNKIVLGENIGQTFSLVYTGNADLGFVALSQVLDVGSDKKANRWDVPDGMFDPIVQQVVLLVHGENNPAAVEFISFMKSETARKIIGNFGYGLE
jgi:molybdate transport system substrate-binding protein